MNHEPRTTGKWPGKFSASSAASFTRNSPSILCSPCSLNSAAQDRSRTTHGLAHHLIQSRHSNSTRLCALRVRRYPELRVNRFERPWHVQEFVAPGWRGEYAWTLRLLTLEAGSLVPALKHCSMDPLPVSGQFRRSAQRAVRHLGAPGWNALLALRMDGG